MPKIIGIDLGTTSGGKDYFGQFRSIGNGLAHVSDIFGDFLIQTFFHGDKCRKSLNDSQGIVVFVDQALQQIFVKSPGG